MRIPKFCAVAATVCLVLWIASPAQAAVPWLTTVPYCADTTMQVLKDPEGRSMTMKGKVCETANGRDTRWEMTSPLGGKTIMIMSGDKRWTLDPERKIYWERRESGKNNPETMIREGKVKITPLGWETINGIRAQKLKIEGVDKRGRRFVLHRWVTKNNVPVRMEGEDFRIDYAHIVTGKQNPGLYRPPGNYQHVEYPGGPGSGPMGVAPGGQMPKDPPPGMTKDQWEQMKKMMEQMQKKQGDPR